jgi:hypothetical protein
MRRLTPIALHASASWRLLLLFAVLGALVVPGGAAAATTVTVSPFEATETICNGDIVHLTGTEVAVVNDNTLTNIRSVDVVGVDLTTGTVYHGEGSVFDIVSLEPSGGVVETLRVTTRLVAAGGQSFVDQGFFHGTLTPLGTFPVFRFGGSTVCT